MSLARLSKAVVKDLALLRFGPPVTHVYNPLDYAWGPHSRYLEKYGSGGKRYLLLGMNPGPYGMAQTGVPFGEVTAVREWLGIEEAVGRPQPEHPKRPIQGFACQRSEVSGQRLWGWARSRFGTPAHFFRQFYVHNYCPLVFMAESGRNITPDKLPAVEREPLFEVCDRLLCKVVRRLAPSMVIGIGAFAEKRARAALAGQMLKIGRILHPSPASPAANRGWAREAELALAALGVEFEAR